MQLHYRERIGLVDLKGFSGMGPTFGGMLESGVKVAKIAEAIVRSV
ncbi:hypothetical protein [Methanococcoides burtonii]|nr:hypothetical protein [Methanococcoides burtonii]